MKKAEKIVQRKLGQRCLSREFNEPRSAEQTQSNKDLNYRFQIKAK